MAAMEGKSKASAIETPAPKPTAHMAVTPDQKVTLAQDKDERTKIPLSNIPLPAEIQPSITDAAAPSIESDAASGSISAKAILLIANEAGLELSDLENDAGFSSLGIDSLMSLVIAEKFRTELDVKVGGSLFLDYPTIGDLRKWLEEYYS